MPRYSIITITRNNLTGLRRTAASLATQICRDFEWIVIDGASNDGTPGFLATTSAQWLSEPDHGIYDAMNKGLARAAGDYVLFLNAGDVLADAAVLADGLALDADFIYGDGHEGGRIKRAHAHKNLLWGMFTYHQAMLYRRAAIGALRYDTLYKIAADYKFTAQFLRGGASALYWPRVMCDFEPGGLSQTAAAAGRRELAAIRTELGLCPPTLNGLITAAHAILWALRRRFPAFYGYMRSVKKP
jgi:putative colanic acid biosynthesis glycosyltransferase